MPSNVIWTGDALVITDTTVILRGISYPVDGIITASVRVCDNWPLQIVLGVTGCALAVWASVGATLSLGLTVFVAAIGVT